MFGRSTSKNAPSTPSRRGLIPSVIAAEMHVLGNIVSEGVLDIDGKVAGNVRCHSVTIRPNGSIHGDVMAETVHVHGTVEGLIKASTVIIYSTARIVGTIMHEALTIEDGAFIDGKFKRTDKVFIEDETLQITHRPRPVAASLDSSFTNDNDKQGDDTPSEAEIHVLKNLRLIS